MLLVYGSYVMYEKHRKNEKMLLDTTMIKHMWIIFFLGMYIYIVVGITILSRSGAVINEVNLLPFCTFYNTFKARKQIYENILMFIPLPMLLYGIGGMYRTLKCVTMIGMGGSILIELLQLVFRLGYFEIDDVITNTVGTVIGLTMCKLFERILREMKHFLKWKV